MAGLTRMSLLALDLLWFFLASRVAQGVGGIRGGGCRVSTGLTVGLCPPI